MLFCPVYFSSSLLETTTWAVEITSEWYVQGGARLSVLPGGLRVCSLHIAGVQVRHHVCQRLMVLGTLSEVWVGREMGNM